jgi:type IV pilus assembly protein PilN
MIRINLLPVKRKKAVIQLYSLLIRSAIILVLTIIVLGILTIHFSGKLSELRDEKAVKEKRLAELEEMLREVRNYEQDNLVYKEKNEIIKQLKRNQYIPVRLLDEVSARLPKGVWLSSLVNRGDVVDINGYSFTNSELVSYVQNLKKSKYFQDVELIESRQTTLGNASLYSFKLTFKVKT